MGRKEIEPDLYQVESLTHPGVTYVVDTREGSCTCPGFRYRGYCKHLKSLKLPADDPGNVKMEKNFKPSKI